MEAETSNHYTILMVLLHDNVFDKHRDDSINTRKQRQIKTWAEPGQKEGQTPKH
jgi:hypothetical protein